jgi:hypothetical protein
VLGAFGGIIIFATDLPKTSATTTGNAAAMLRDDPISTKSQPRPSVTLPYSTSIQTPSVFHQTASYLPIPASQDGSHCTDQRTGKVVEVGQPQVCLQPGQTVSSMISSSNKSTDPQPRRSEERRMERKANKRWGLGSQSDENSDALDEKSTTQRRVPSVPLILVRVFIPTRCTGNRTRISSRSTSLARKTRSLATSLMSWVAPSPISRTSSPIL